MKDEIVKLNNEIKFLKLKVASSKFCLHNKAVYNIVLLHWIYFCGNLKSFFWFWRDFDLCLWNKICMADQLEISSSTVSRIFTTWINFLYFRFKELPVWPPQAVFRNDMPTAFKSKYPFTRVILDATEIYCKSHYF